jgi:dTDP-4-amino-4,6-dideoxygalactose transaminase
LPTSIRPLLPEASSAVTPHQGDHACTLRPPACVDAIQAIADNYNLKVIYDAAHAFGVRDDGGSVLRQDLSVLSFHATKVFNTFEGGAIVCPDAKTKQRIDHLKNFGYVDEVTVVAPGINGKMNEVSAAFGLLQLKHVDEALALRKQIDAAYREALVDVPGIRCVEGAGERVANYTHFPILVDPGYAISRDALYQKLREHDVYARRYFFPLISEFPMYRGLASAGSDNLPVATEVARQAVGKAADTARAGYDQTGKMIRSRPVESLAVCFGVGLITGVVVGLLIRSK